MIRDVFYYGNKPNVHPREKHAKNLEDARFQSTTEHFWIINEYCIYKDFDWDFDFDYLPDEIVWTQEHNNIWPSVHQKDSGTWLCPKEFNDVLIYRADVEPLLRTTTELWHFIDKIDTNKFDLTWHPDPTDPPYIYLWGCKFFPVELQHVLEYKVDNATQIKYMDQIVELLPNYDCIVETQKIDKNKFDISWRPNPLDPPYIYVWGNKYIPAEIQSTLEYHAPNAKDKKYMGNIAVLPLSENFKITQQTVDFDYSWRPDPREPAYIYVWGNEFISAELKPTVEYHCPGATEKKYMGNVKVAPEWDKYKILVPVDKNSFDFSWRPDPREPPYIYVWGNQSHSAELEPTIEYYCEGATDRKYLYDRVAKTLPDLENFKVLIPVTDFNYAWRPHPHDPPYIYVFGNQWHDAMTEPTIEYHTPGATEKKYVTDIIAKVSSTQEHWKTLYPVENFDYSWRPDPHSLPYIYVWGNKYIPGELQSTIEYHTPNAIDKKYMGDVKVLPELDRWVEVQPIDKTKFDLCWRPDPREPAYIYVWGNKYIPGELQSTIEYHTPNATEKKYMGNAPVIPLKNFKIIQEIDVTKFDLCWRPDPREPAYIYTWGNKFIPAEILPTLEFYCEGATERKYMGNVEVIPEFNRWVEVQPIDKTKFDLSWRPDPREPPYIYVWGNKYISAELKSTLEYHTLGATDKKYMGDVEVLPLSENWKITQQVNNFDFTWRPDPREPDYIYTWGNKYISGELLPTIEYYCPNATERKYMGDIEVIPEWDKYKILIPIEKTSFEFSWRPDPREPPYIYVWGNQSHSAEIEPTIEYHCINATERKYMNDRVAKTLPNIENFKILIPTIDFDFSWRPDPGSPPYIYVFGNQWHDAMTEPTIEYHTPGATEKKYVTDIITKVNPTQENWKTLIPVTGFDYSWRPNPHSTPYIYVFGNQWNPIELEHTVEYHTPGATNYKYITDIVAKLKPTNTEKHWKKLIPIETFDYSWRPDPREPALIYVFGNKWNDAKTEPSVEYHCEGATERKFMDYPVAVPTTIFKYWSISNNDDLETFDFSWRPNPFSQPQIYQWENNGPRYTVPGATDVVLMRRNSSYNKQIISRYYINTTVEELIREHPEEVFWALNPDLNYDKFDFSWRPSEENFRHINVFGNQYSKNTHTYYVNGPMYSLGHRDYNYVEDNIVTAETNLSMFFVDKGNSNCNKRFEELKDRYPALIKTRYLNSWVDTINRCINKSQTKLFWVVSSELDYSDFQFDFYPSPWQEKMIHVFGTQHSHWGNTYMINREYFAEDTKYVKIIEHLSGLNFVKNKKAKAVDILYDIVYIDHGNVPDVMKELENSGHLIIKYNSSYLKTFSDILSKLPNKKEHYVWIVSSICDYSNFDFTYICDPFTNEQLHVFPSAGQKFGDTFFVNVNELRTQIAEMNLLEDYNKINYNQYMRIPRLPAPEFVLNDDTLVNAVNYSYQFPYAIFKTHDNININTNDSIPISLWSDDSKNILITSTGSTRIIVPKEAKEYVEKELYDYPYIAKVDKLIDSNPLDVVFLSNGEIKADEHYEHLLKVCKNTGNRIVRVDGVKGRVNAYHAALNASHTPWAFTVFAKLKVNEHFDWSWQPDRLQVPKHYIFHATNILNNLEYGHQAMIAYNKKLVLNNFGKGLDFTLDDEHEVIKLSSGVALFNTDEFSTWRTAFREVIKLKKDDSEESSERLKVWCTVAQGDYADYCIDGAKHALEYYEEVSGDLTKLRLSYDWPWLQEYFNKRYN